MKSPYLVDVKREKRIRQVATANGCLMMTVAPVFVLIAIGKGEYLGGLMIAAGFFPTGFIAWRWSTRLP